MFYCYPVRGLAYRSMGNESNAGHQVPGRDLSARTQRTARDYCGRVRVGGPNPPTLTIYSLKSGRTEL